MGFFSEVLILFFAGIFNAWLYARKLRKRNRDWDQILWVLWDFGVIGCGVLVYLNVIPVGLLHTWLPWVQATNGPNWMWNSFQLFGAPVLIDYSALPATAQSGLNTIAALIFLCYFGIYHLGGDFGRMLYGRRSHEGGLWYGLAPLHKPKEAKEAEKSAKK
ncbi:MAG TPA: hypothetical protein VKK79_11840 [Candidatus Lokiarchaeia archaeon]|nr:hypothetical protein [Candidatus Lokiarchaeia archaeon]